MPFSASQLEWFFTRDGAEAGIWLLTLSGLDLPTGTLRLARNGEDFVSRGHVFGAAWFDAALPVSAEEQPQAQLSIPNVDREIGLAILEMQHGLYAHIELVQAGTPDIVVQSWRMLRLRAVTIDPLVVQGQLSVARLDTEPYGTIRVVPRHFPWLNYIT